MQRRCLRHRKGLQFAKRWLWRHHRPGRASIVLLQLLVSEHHIRKRHEFTLAHSAYLGLTRLLMHSSLHVLKRHEWIEWSTAHRWRSVRLNLLDKCQPLRLYLQFALLLLCFALHFILAFFCLLPTPLISKLLQSSLSDGICRATISFEVCSQHEIFNGVFSLFTRDQDVVHVLLLEPRQLFKFWGFVSLWIHSVSIFIEILWLLKLFSFFLFGFFGLFFLFAFAFEVSVFEVSW